MHGTCIAGDGKTPLLYLYNSLYLDYSFLSVPYVSILPWFSHMWTLQHVLLFCWTPIPKKYTTVWSWIFLCKTVPCSTPLFNDSYSMVQPTFCQVIRVKHLAIFHRLFMSFCFFLKFLLCCLKYYWFPVCSQHWEHLWFWNKWKNVFIVSLWSKQVTSGIIPSIFDFMNH